ncbi:MAG: patatin-like phospholipase family protein [Acholeplasmataceae bacterium]|nr:patatin-like phospholipase family protein [Acholeplasmataceae bacterium]
MPKIGLVLSGALSKGAYQLGFLKALNEKINTKHIKIIAGTSIGACNAYSFSTNKLDVLEKLWLEFDISNAFKLWRKVVFKNTIRKHLNILMTDGDEAKIPFYVTTLRVFPWWKFRYIRFEGNYQKHWLKMINGAVGFPIITGPATFHKFQVYTDGGIVDNIPIRPLNGYDLDLIIVLHFDPKFKINYRAYGKTIVVDVDCSAGIIDGQRSFDFSNKNVSKMIDIGYNNGIKTIDRLVYQVENGELLDEAKKIRKEQEKARENQRALDSWPTRLNRVFKKQRDKLNIKSHIDDYQ